MKHAPGSRRSAKGGSASGGKARSAPPRYAAGAFRHRVVAERLVVALDFISLSDAVKVAQQLRRFVRTVKVGALFTAHGPLAIQRMQALGFEVMLDLKFFDIPNTVELHCRAATRLRVSRLTVHAGDAENRPMLEAAMRGVRDEAKQMRLSPARRPKVLAITKLTSAPNPPTIHGGSETIGGPRETRTQVFERVAVALQAECDGIVVSTEEAQEVRQAFRDAAYEMVCPGIRPSWACRDDQRRIGTPAQALRAGADVLVVGRPITAAQDPAAAARRILDEMEEVLC